MNQNVQTTNRKPSPRVAISQQQLDELKQSKDNLEHFLKQHKILGWPKVITTEPGKHFIPIN